MNSILSTQDILRPAGGPPAALRSPGPVYSFPVASVRSLTAACAICAAILGFAGSARAADAKPPTTAPAPIQDDIDSAPISAPDVGTMTQRISAGARGSEEQMVRVFLFAPRTVGATLQEHPTFYWYLTRPTDGDTELVVSTVEVSRPGRPATDSAVLMKKKIPASQPAGIYWLKLEGKPLEPGQLCKISVVHPDPGHDTSKDTRSEGYLIRLPEPKAAPPDPADPRSCAAAGLWYDAIDAAMLQVINDPANPMPHRRLHAMLRGEHVFQDGPPPAHAPDAARRAEQKEQEYFKQLDVDKDATPKHDAAEEVKTDEK